MRYCATMHLKRYQKYDKLKSKLLLIRFRCLDFDLSYIFDIPLGTGSYSTSLESFQLRQIWAKRAKLWQHFKYLSENLEKS